IVATSDGGFLLAGNSYSFAGNDKSEDAKGLSDFWLVKIDSLGNVLWDRTFGGDKEDENPKVAVLSDGSFLIAGTSISHALHDKTVHNRGVS
ncbi:MAG: T9SS C-terminal target domain-containing protein, partial [Bacteroidota bacterium]